VRAPDATIPAPPFPRGTPWVNVASLRMDRQRGRPVLVEFWDFCRVNSLRTLPYLEAWHERYAEAGLRIVGVHTGGYPPSRDDDEVRRAVARLGIPWAVAIDTQLEIWELYGNEGWPARYLWDADQALHSLHYGEGAYDETEREIQALLGVEREVLAPLRPEDAPGALLAPMTPEQPGAYSGPYEAAEAWAVVSGAGELVANGRRVPVTHPGCVPLARHGFHTAATLQLVPGPGVTVHATVFTPGVPRD
jgi:thiol-disulfide isomerase/thioredoxin